MRTRRSKLQRDASSEHAKTVTASHIRRMETPCYQASAQELEGLEVNSVEHLVEVVNDHGLKSGQGVITEFDFPRNEKKFKRLAERWRRILAARPLN